MKNPHAIKVVSQRQSLQIDFAGAFKAVIKGVKNAVSLDPEKLGLDLIDLSKSLSLATSVEQKAYLLITEGYIGALASIWRTYWHVFKRSNDEKDLAKFADAFDSVLTRDEPSLEPEFFLAPHRFSVVPTFVEKLAKELPSYLKEPQLATEISETFPDRFYESVIAAWNHKQGKYQDIWTHFQKNQFLDIQKHLDKFRILAAQEEYHNSLRKMFHEVVMGNEAGMTLADIYVKPSFRVSERCFDETDRRYVVHKTILRHSPFISVSYNGSIHEYMDAFLNQEDPLELASSKANVLLLLGYPGQGKTSFCKRLLHDLLGSGRSDQHVFYLPLRLVKNVREKLSTPLDLVLDALNHDLTDQYPGTVTEILLRDSVLILDGLDEIFQREGLSHADIDDFCRELARLTVDAPNLKIVLTSRYGYIDLSKLRKKEFFIAQLEPLDISQQSEWLEKYVYFHPDTSLTQEKLHEINDVANINYASIRELINQPILLQLVATADYELRQTDTRTKIYDELFQSLLDRNWAKSGQLDNLEGLGKEDVLSYLSEIAMAIYQSEFEYIRKVDLEKLPSTTDFLALLKGQDLKDVLKNLMVAFYMKEVNKEGSYLEEEDRSYAIEFLHKSLQEYLVARNIWETAKNEFLETKGRSRQKKYVINSWKEALRVIRELFAHKELSTEVQQYLVDMIQQDTEEEKWELHGRILKFFHEMTERDFGEFSVIRSGNNSPIDESLNSFYGCYLLISHIGLGSVNWNQNISNRFSYLLRTPHPRKSRYTWLFKGALLPNADLRRVDFRGANLEGAYLENANLQGAHLQGANLQGANLQGANLKHANLENADLEGANLKGANLKHANLERAYLFEVNLFEASLFLANLFKAYLTVANLEGADLEGADLEGADLYGANLEGAILEGANLGGANLERAILEGANLGGANLGGANLVEVNLEGANLERANLTRVNLEGANLERAFLTRVNLEGANLRRAFLLEANLFQAKLFLANLSKAYLKGANLKGAIFLGANLHGVYLCGANLEGAYLEGVNFEGAILYAANLEGENLKRTNLKGADLEEANLKGAHLEGANLQKANLKGVTLEGANLEGAFVDNVDWLDILVLRSNEMKEELLSNYKVISLPSEDLEKRFMIAKRE